MQASDNLVTEFIFRSKLRGIGPSVVGLYVGRICVIACPAYVKTNG
jgi:hypothetical protein